MSGGRPRTPIGQHGEIWMTMRGRKHVANTWVRDQDGKLRQATATGSSSSAAKVLLKERIAERDGMDRHGQLSRTSRFTTLADLWLADLDVRDLTDGTREVYQDMLRLHVRPAFENFSLAEITTGRVEWFLKAQHAVSYSQASKCRTILNLLFGYALRHDAVSRNPVEGTSPLARPKGAPKALTLEQIAAIREAAARWRTDNGVPGPKPDGQVRDIIEILAGTGMRPGEVLAIRPCDVTDGKNGMVIHVCGTVVQRRGKGTFRQPHPKTHASDRHVPVPEFAAVVLRRRLKGLRPGDFRTVFANRGGQPLSPHNVRRTFREFLVLAGLDDSGISPRWYRRTVATVVARAMGKDAAAAFLGHTSVIVTEGHYIEPEKTIDRTPTGYLESTLRADQPDATYLAVVADEVEEAILDEIDTAADNEGDDAA